MLGCHFHLLENPPVTSTWLFENILYAGIGDLISGIVGYMEASNTVKRFSTSDEEASEFSVELIIRPLMSLRKKIFRMLLYPNPQWIYHYRRLWW